MLDGVADLLNMSEAGIEGMFLVYPDPSFDEFEGGTKSIFHVHKHDDVLTINVSAVL